MCRIPKCENEKIVGRGWCGMHYERWRRHGNPHKVHKRGPRRLTAEEIFHSGYEIDDWYSGCWIWKKSRTREGYGLGHFHPRFAHRFAYQLLVGELVPGLTIDHLCMNRACVNPDHLEQITLADNLRRAHRARAEAKATIRADLAWMDLAHSAGM